MGYWPKHTSNVESYDRFSQPSTMRLKPTSRFPMIYFVPRNLAIKAEILAKFGDAHASDELYRKSTDLIDALLSKVPTPTVERQLLAQLSEVYAGYFASLSNRGRNKEAFPSNRTCPRASGSAGA